MKKIIYENVFCLQSVLWAIYILMFFVLNFGLQIIVAGAGNENNTVGFKQLGITWPGVDTTVHKIGAFNVAKFNRSNEWFGIIQVMQLLSAAVLIGITGVIYVNPTPEYENSFYFASATLSIFNLLSVILFTKKMGDIIDDCVTIVNVNTMIANRKPKQALVV